MIKLEILHRPSTIRDLGAHFDLKLSLNKHIEAIITLAYKMLAFVIRNSKVLKNIIALRLLLITFVRSQLDYASAV